MKNGERQAFRLFCTLRGLEPGRFKEKDPPDFVRDDGELGIELVEYHKDIGPRGSRRREREEIVWKRIQAGKERFRELSRGLRMDVFVWLRRDGIPSLDAMMKLAEFAAANRGGRIELREGALPTWMSDAFDGVDIFPTWELQEDILWQAPEATNVDPNLEAIDVLLKQKDAKVPAYRKLAKQVWLVIHSGWSIVGDPDGSRPSTCARIGPRLLQRAFQSDFDGVYFLDRAGQRLAQLQLTSR